MKKIFLICLFFLFLVGCATTANYQRILDNWQGAQMSDLINVWGYPDAAVKLPDGNTVYMYMRQRFYTAPATPMMTPAIANINGVPTYITTYSAAPISSGETVSLSCRTWFEVNRRGEIVNTRFQGNNCIAGRSSRLNP